MTGIGGTTITSFHPGALDKEGAGVRAGGGGGEKGKHEQRAIHPGTSGKAYESQVRASSDFVTAAFAGGTDSAPASNDFRGG